MFAALVMQKDSCHPDVFRELFFRLAGRIRRFLYYKSGDWDASEDFTQEVFLRLWKKCSEVLPEQAAGFLFTAANNLFLDNARHQQVHFRFVEHEKTGPSSFSPDPDTVLAEKEMEARLQTALEKLSDGQRTVFLMSRIDKMRYAEIADCLGISVKAVEKRMHGALLELKKLLEEQ